MSSGTVCGQTPILDLAAGVREHLAAKCESIVENEENKYKWYKKDENGFVKNKLIGLYCTICQCNDSRFRKELQRQSNNNCPQFTDEELITVYL